MHGVYPGFVLLSQHYSLSWPSAVWPANKKCRSEIPGHIICITNRTRCEPCIPASPSGSSVTVLLAGSKTQPARDLLHLVTTLTLPWRVSTVVPWHALITIYSISSHLLKFIRRLTEKNKPVFNTQGHLSIPAVKSNHHSTSTSIFVNYCPILWFSDLRRKRTTKFRMWTQSNTTL